MTDNSSKPRKNLRAYMVQMKRKLRQEKGSKKDGQNNKTQGAKKPMDTTSKIILIVGVIAIVIGASWLLYHLIDYMRGQAIYEDISTEYTETVVEDTAQPEGWFTMCQVDIPKLKEINPDTKGWIFFENEDISYPIVQGTDNEKYLNTSFEGAPLREGSIFLETLNSEDFSDTNSIIYGHNMRDQSMFGKLQKYKFEQDYYKDHPYFQVITNDRVYRFQVFAFNDVDENSDVYYMTFGTTQEYLEYLRMLKGLSQVHIVAPDVSAPGSSNDEKLLSNYKKLVTLSTCTADDNQRFVVIGTLVGEYDRVNKKVIYDSVGDTT